MKPAIKNTKSLIMGCNCLEEVLQHKPDIINQVYMLDTQSPVTTRKENILVLLKKHKVPISYMKKDALSRLVDSDSHQGIVAAIRNRNFSSLKEFLTQVKDQSHSCVVMLDSIQDPQNLGAIFRVSECFGVDAIVWSKNRTCDLTPVVSKSSVGASELVLPIKVSNLVDAILKFKKEGYWIVCADIDQSSHSIYDFDFPEKTVIILGSEGKGFQQTIKSHADFMVHVPLVGKISSLNVSQATSIILSHFQAGKDPK